MSNFMWSCQSLATSGISTKNARLETCNTFNTQKSAHLVEVTFFDYVTGELDVRPTEAYYLCLMSTHLKNKWFYLLLVLLIKNKLRYQ